MKLFLFFSIFLFGCVASTQVSIIRLPGEAQKSKYVPSNYDNQDTGLVRYRIGNNLSYNQASREEAFRIMYESCGGNYEIVSEKDSNGATQIIDQSWGATAVTSKWIIVEFRCGKKGNRDENGILHIAPAN